MQPKLLKYCSAVASYTVSQPYLFDIYVILILHTTNLVNVQRAMIMVVEDFGSGIHTLGTF